MVNRLKNIVSPELSRNNTSLVEGRLMRVITFNDNPLGWYRVPGRQDALTGYEVTWADCLKLQQVADCITANRGCCLQWDGPKFAFWFECRDDANIFYEKTIGTLFAEKFID